MTVPMDSNKGNSSRERAQRLFNENVDLENKRRKAVQERTPLDPNIWQNMRENYEAIVLEDHDFSEQHDVEYALWQLHYRRIEELRAHFNAAVSSAGSGAPPNGKVSVQSGPERLAKIRSRFKSFLSEATGFYHDLMLKIRAKYGLELGYFSDDPVNPIPKSKHGSKSSMVEKGLISCHRCLIYLGDLARYKGLYREGDSKSQEFSAAASYYMQASSVCPSSGNPHHQLAILAGYSNDELLTIYRYFRSLAVDKPCATARDNLIIAFEKNRQTYNQLISETKAATGKAPPGKMAGRGRSKSRTPIRSNKTETTVFKERTSNYLEVFKTFTTRFVRLNGVIFTRTSLETFAEVLSAVKNDLSELLSSGPDDRFTFGSDAAECKLAMVRISVILIFTVHNVSRENAKQSYADTLQRSVLLQNAFTATFEFMGCIIERCDQLKDPASSFLLPGILIFVEWLACHQDVTVATEMEEKQANARAFFWKRCVSFLNKLLSTGYVGANEDEDESCFMNMSSYDESETSNRVALPEDFELRGFVPLLPAQLILDFSRKRSFESDGDKEKVSRVQRIFAAGKALANAMGSLNEGFHFDSKLKIFVFGPVPETIDGSSDLGGGLPATPTREQGPRDVDTEDDDEIIVFKPFGNDKTIDDLSSKMASSAILSPVYANGHIEFRSNTQFSGSVDHNQLQSTVDAAIKPPVALAHGIANGTLQNFPPVHHITQGWSSDHSTPVVNGLAELKSRGGQSIHMHQLHGEFGNLQPRFTGIITGLGSAAQVLQPHLPFESSLPLKQPSIAPPGLKKHARHAGPPPGFGSVPSKSVDDPSDFQIPVMDDYSWLDGYDPSSTSVGPGFSSSRNQMDQLCSIPPSTNQLGPVSSPSTGAETFPFPGKPVSSSLPFSSKDQVLNEVSFPEYMKHHDGLQDKFRNGNHQMVYSAEPFPGSSLWGGRSFV